MPSREKIREVLGSWRDDRCLFLVEDKPCLSNARGNGYCSSDEGFYNCLIKRLDELGVVIKVESSEHTNPECDWCYWNTHKVESLI